MPEEVNYFYKNSSFNQSAAHNDGSNGAEKKKLNECLWKLLNEIITNCIWLLSLTVKVGTMGSIRVGLCLSLGGPKEFSPQKKTLCFWNKCKRGLS